MNEHLTAREFDQFRIDDREWKQQMDARLDTFMTTLGSQDKRLTAVETSIAKTTATTVKINAGIVAVVTAIVNGIIASFSAGSK